MLLHLTDVKPTREQASPIELEGTDKIYPCRYVRVCDQMSCPVLNGRYVRIGTEVLCIGTDVDVLMDHDGVVRT